METNRPHLKQQFEPSINNMDYEYLTLYRATEDGKNKVIHDLGLYNWELVHIVEGGYYGYSIHFRRKTTI